jgi:catalase-peroxidase
MKLKLNLPQTLKSLFVLSLMVSIFGCAKSNDSSHAKTVAGMDNRSPQFWWPDRLDLMPLRQHGMASNPMGEKFDYAAEFAKVDLDALKKMLKI